MGILDDYQQNIDDEGVQAANPIDVRKKRAELERQVVILNSDLKKILREIEEMEIRKRKFKKEAERIRVDEDALDKELKKLNTDRTFLEEEIQGLKKKLKTLL